MQEVIKNLENARFTRDRLGVSDFDHSSGVSGRLSEIASFQVGELLSIDASKSFRVSPVAREEFTTDGNAGNTETFSLSHRLIESAATAESLILFLDDGSTVSRVQPESIDFAGDSFNYTDGATDNTLVAFFASGEGARLVVRVQGPDGSRHDIMERDLGLLHQRDTLESPLSFDFDDPLAGVVPKQWEIKLLVRAPYVASSVYDGSERVRAPNALLSVPVRRSMDTIDGVTRSVRQYIASQ